MKTENLDSVPYYYSELSNDELYLLLYYNYLALEFAQNNSVQDYYQKKIEYISGLIGN